MPGPDRDRIHLAPDEVDALLDESSKLQVATIGRDGTPHLVPLFFVVRGGRITFWTHARSQKVVNLRRDPRLTCLVEQGERTEEVRFAQFRARAEIDDDPVLVEEVGRLLWERYVGAWDALAREEQGRRGRRRVVVTVHPHRVVTWDHRKLHAGSEGAVTT